MFDVPELVSETPTRVYFPPELKERAEELLVVTDRSAEFGLKRLKSTRGWYVPKFGQAAYDAEVSRLTTKRDRSMVFMDGDRPWTYSGLWKHLSVGLLEPVQAILPHRVAYELPEPRTIPWKRTPEEIGKPPRPHQIAGFEALAACGHGSAEYACGTGKSLMLAMLLRHFGLRSGVVVYSAAIAEQLLELLETLLGSRYVGMFDGGTKQVGKLITVCSALAVANLKPGSPAYEWLAGCDLLLGDESHTFAAATLLSLSQGVFAGARRRYFVSATQMRGDGLDLVLLGVVGPTVVEKTFRAAVDEGLLARPSFYQVVLSSDSKYDGKDMDRATREHLYENVGVAKAVGVLVREAFAHHMPVLVLAEEFEQVALLLRHLPAGMRVMHGGTGDFEVAVMTKERGVLDVKKGHRIEAKLSESERFASMSAETFIGWFEEAKTDSMQIRDWVVPGGFLTVLAVGRVRVTGEYLLSPEHRKVSVADVRDSFNDGETLGVVSTSAGRVGVDMTPPTPDDIGTMLVINLMGGTSEVGLVQGIGRGARRQRKADFIFVDAWVGELARHGDRRAEIVEGLWGTPPLRMETQEMVEVLRASSGGST